MNYIYHINIFIFCDMLGLFSSTISIVNTSVLRYNHQASFVSKSKILNHCGKVKFKDNLPSSFLAATFRHCLFTPNDCLQRKI